jgi:hypothetical protein
VNRFDRHAIDYFDPSEFATFILALKPIDQTLVELALQTMVVDFAPSDSKWVSALPEDVFQLRLGPTRANVLKRLNVDIDRQSRNHNPLLLRIYFTKVTKKPLILAAYDKLAAPLRSDQKRIIELATSRRRMLDREVDK